MTFRIYAGLAVIVELWARALAYLTAHWRLVGVVALVALLGVQTARLAHAKADQFDRTACVRGQPCKPKKWKDEVKGLRTDLAAARRDLGTCRQNTQTLNAAIEAQNRAVDALKADGERRVAEAARGLSLAIQGRAAAEAKARAVLATRRTGDECADMRAIDQQLMGTIR